MSGAVYDRSIAFQASESALREAEAMLQEGTAVFPANGCAAGICAERTNLNSPDLAYWSDPAVAWLEATDALAVDSDGDGTSLATNPEFIIEAMGRAPNWPGCDREDPVSDQCMSPRYRVTARSSEANRAQVILQTSVSAQQ